MTEAGTTQVAAGATLSQSGATTLAAGRLLENAGTYQFLSDTFAFEGVAPAPSIHNTGTISKTGGAVEATIFVGLANAGTVTSTSGRLSLFKSAPGAQAGHVHRRQRHRSHDVPRRDVHARRGRHAAGNRRDRRRQRRRAERPDARRAEPAAAEERRAPRAGHGQRHGHARLERRHAGRAGDDDRRSRRARSTWTGAPSTSRTAGSCRTTARSTCCTTPSIDAFGRRTVDHRQRPRDRARRHDGHVHRRQRARRRPARQQHGDRDDHQVRLDGSRRRGSRGSTARSTTTASSTFTPASWT